MPHRLILTHVGKTLPNRVAEWLLGAMLTSWGLILLRPEPTFEISNVYSALAAIATEEVWAWGCLAVGSSRLIALFINGIWVPPTYHLRSATSALSVLFWFTISYGLMATGEATTGLAVYPWLVPAELYCLYRTARDYNLAILTWKAEQGLPTNDAR